jgi:hypothetical protein
MYGYNNLYSDLEVNRSLNDKIEVTKRDINPKSVTQQGGNRGKLKKTTVEVSQ